MMFFFFIDIIEKIKTFQQAKNNKYDIKYKLVCFLKFTKSS